MTAYFSRLFAFILPRLSERSTAAGFLSVVGLLIGHAIAPDRSAAIATAITVAASMALVVTKEAPAAPVPAP